MKKVKVDFTLRAVSRKGQVTRYDLNVILKDINANQKVYGKNFANIEVQPAKALDMGDYQLICNERKIGDLMQNSKGFRVNDCDAEAGITENSLKVVVATKGHYSLEDDISTYSDVFITRWIFPNWSKITQAISKTNGGK